MQTIYYTTDNFVRHTGNIVDLQDYRRRLALTQEGCLAAHPCEEEWNGEDCAPQECPPQLHVVERHEQWDERSRSHQRRERRALALDMWASAGVLVMTLAFTLQLVMG